MMTIKPRERDAILHALAAGVVPKIGLNHIQVGRAREVEAVMQDLARIANGGSTIRFVIGYYGAGKTFFLNLVRLIAHKERLVTLNADLAVDRRLHSTGGQARTLYAETMRNLATANRPEGGALRGIIERFITDVVEDARLKGLNVEAQIHARLSSLQDLVSGHDFATVIAAYWRGSNENDEELKSAALRWLHGEFTTKTDAKSALGVRTVIDGASIYDHWKLLARFVRIAGYKGLLVLLDELVNIYKLSSGQARNSNYEQILRILNDTLQANVEGLGFLMAGPPDFLEDMKKGLYSYPALQSRLATNEFAINGLIDLNGPVLRLDKLTKEELYLLLQKVRTVFAASDPNRQLVPDGALTSFIGYCESALESPIEATPRVTLRSFLQLLNVLDQNPGANWRTVLSHIPIAPDDPAAAPEAAEEPVEFEEERT